MNAVQRGCFLIANPSLRDPNFSRTVVLLCEHGADGSMGLVINRPTPYSLAEALAGIEPDTGCAHRLWWGGPVQNQLALAVHRGQSPPAAAREIVEGMALLADMDALRQLLKVAPAADPSVRVFSGYAGWGSGQLQSEMDEKSWIVSPVRPELVFAPESAGVWAAALKPLGPRYEFLATMPEDPRVN